MAIVNEGWVAMHVTNPDAGEWDFNALFTCRKALDEFISSWPPTVEYLLVAKVELNKPFPVEPVLFRHAWYPQVELEPFDTGERPLWVLHNKDRHPFPPTDRSKLN